MRFSVEYGVSRKRIDIENNVQIPQFKRVMKVVFGIEAEEEDILIQEWDEEFSDFFDTEAYPLNNKLRVVVRQKEINTSGREGSSDLLTDDESRDPTIPLASGTGDDSLPVDGSGDPASNVSNQDNAVNTSARYVAMMGLTTCFIFHS